MHLHWEDYTKTETAILKILIDGKGHGENELFKCLPEDCLGDKRNLKDNLKNHIYNIRKKLEFEDLGIFYQSRGGRRGYEYIMARLLVVRTNE